MLATDESTQNTTIYRLVSNIYYEYCGTAKEIYEELLELISISGNSVSANGISVNGISDNGISDHELEHLQFEYYYTVDYTIINNKN